MSHNLTLNSPIVMDESFTHSTDGEVSSPSTTSLPMLGFRDEFLMIGGGEKVSKEERAMLNRMEERKKKDAVQVSVRKEETQVGTDMNVLHYEEAANIFNTFGKNGRIKNGIALSRACLVYKTAWELPEEKGRVLPSRVIRHFKHCLPSSKSSVVTKNSKTMQPSPKASINIKVKDKDKDKDKIKKKEPILSKVSITTNNNDNVTKSLVALANHAKLNPLDKLATNPKFFNPRRTIHISSTNAHSKHSLNKHRAPLTDLFPLSSQDTTAITNANTTASDNDNLKNDSTITAFDWANNNATQRIRADSVDSVHSNSHRFQHDTPQDVPIRRFSTELRYFLPNEETVKEEYNSENRTDTRIVIDNKESVHQIEKEKDNGIITKRVIGIKRERKRKRKKRDDNKKMEIISDTQTSTIDTSSSATNTHEAIDVNEKKQINANSVIPLNNSKKRRRQSLVSSTEIPQEILVPIIPVVKHLENTLSHEDLEQQDWDEDDSHVDGYHRHHTRTKSLDSGLDQLPLESIQLFSPSFESSRAHPFDFVPFDDPSKDELKRSVNSFAAVYTYNNNVNHATESEILERAQTLPDQKSKERKLASIRKLKSNGRDQKKKRGRKEKEGKGQQQQRGQEQDEKGNEGQPGHVLSPPQWYSHSQRNKKIQFALAALGLLDKESQEEMEKAQERERKEKEERKKKQRLKKELETQKKENEKQFKSMSDLTKTF
ncbi:hypothetical protein RFI_14409, partial [Reticulomyxa filosa]